MKIDAQVLAALDTPEGEALFRVAFERAFAEGLEALVRKKAKAAPKKRGKIRR